VLGVQPAVAGSQGGQQTDSPPPIALQAATTPLSLIVDIQHSGDGRLFVVQQTGQIYIYDGISVLPTPFLNIQSLITPNCPPCGEQGLLGLAFHPNYSVNGYFYVFHTDSNGDLAIARYSVSVNPNIADPDSRSLLLLIDHPPATNHNGGRLAFGSDGYLYISTGDGGSTPQNGQALNTLLGKILRIDVDGGSPYAIPEGNPFVESPVDDSNTLAEIWAYGLRNPWRFTFDRLTHDMLIGDVGAGEWEEIDLQSASSTGGVNYGWNLMEGTHCFTPGCNAGGTMTAPILEYQHISGCYAVTGGFRYRGSRYPALEGVYLYGDYCSGKVWGATPDATNVWSSAELLDNPFNVATFGEDMWGEVYLGHYGSGPVYRIIAPGQRSPHADFNSDGKSDIGFFHPGTGVWGILQSVHNFSYLFSHWFSWGQVGDLPVTGDFDGDGKVDPAVRRPPAGVQSAAYLILKSSTGYNYGSSLTIPAGWPGLGDTPVVGDFNGDGIDEPAIWRGNTGAWIIPLSPAFDSYRFLRWGESGDTPVGADVDGDGQTDIGYWRPSTGVWGFLRSSQGYSYSSPLFFSWGTMGDLAVMADYDGDGLADPAAVIPPASGQSRAYRILLSTLAYDPTHGMTIPAGWPGLNDTPVPADYDGDGKADAGIWRGNTGVWIIPISSMNNTGYLFALWGEPGDQPAR
jgi:hypothetical protein